MARSNTRSSPLKALLDHLDLTKPNIELLVVDYDLNGPEVALLSAKLLVSMIKKKMG